MNSRGILRPTPLVRNTAQVRVAPATHGPEQSMEEDWAQIPSSPTHLALQLATHTARIQPGQTPLRLMAGLSNED